MVKKESDMGLSDPCAGALRPEPEKEWALGVVVHCLKTFVCGITPPIVNEQEVHGTVALS